MERDLRETPLYKDVEDFYRRSLGPGFGRTSDVSDPRPSPDGRCIAFRGDQWERLDGHTLGRIGLAATDGSWVRQITNGPHDDDQPRWSPDGRTLTFRSDRAAEGRHQLYALDVDAIGEARALPVVEGVAELHAWSPNGTAVMVVVAGLEAEQSDAVGSGVIGQSEDLPPWIPEVDSFDGVDRTRRRLMIMEMASDELRPGCRADLNIWEADWCEEDCVVAIASEEPGESAWYRARVVMIDTSAGTDRTLFESDVQLGWVSSSPTSDVVAVVEAVCSDRLVVAGDLVLIDPADGTVRRPDTLGVDVAFLSWRADGVLIATGVRGLETVVLEVDVEAGIAKERWATSEAGGRFFLAAAPVGDDIVIALNSAARPPELVVVSGHDPRTIVSTSNDGTDVVRSSVASRTVLSWTAPDGLEIQAFLTLPHGDGPFPLILDVHGGPVWAFADSWPGTFTGFLLSRGFALLQPNPRGSWGRGRDFASQVVGDMGGADAQDLLAGVDHVLEMGIADPGRSACSVAATVGSWRRCCPVSTSGSPPPCPFRPSPIGIPSGSTATSARGCRTSWADPSNSRRSSIGSEAPSSRPSAIERRRSSPPGCATARPRSGRPRSSTERCASVTFRRNWCSTRWKATAFARSPASSTW